jgi:hypothetical protein
VHNYSEAEYFKNALSKGTKDRQGGPRLPKMPQLQVWPRAGRGRRRSRRQLPLPAACPLAATARWRRQRLSSGCRPCLSSGAMTSRPQPQPLTPTLAPAPAPALTLALPHPTSPRPAGLPVLRRGAADAAVREGPRARGVQAPAGAGRQGGGQRGGRRGGAAGHIGARRAAAAVAWVPPPSFGSSGCMCVLRVEGGVLVPAVAGAAMGSWRRGGCELAC